jgi:hypothetical protein
MPPVPAAARPPGRVRLPRAGEWVSYAPPGYGGRSVYAQVIAVHDQADGPPLVDIVHRRAPGSFREAFTSRVAFGSGPGRWHWPTPA